LKKSDRINKIFRIDFLRVHGGQICFRADFAGAFSGILSILLILSEIHFLDAWYDVQSGTRHASGCAGVFRNVNL
jgi:hypothetical protein